MKNLKTPAQRPRKAPSNQTGGTAWGKKLAAEISRMAQAADMKKLILLNFPYIIAFYMVEKAAWLYRHCNGDSVVDRLMVLFMNFGLAYKSVLPSFHPFDLLVGLVGAAALKAVIYFKGKNAKKYRQGEEYGSARWGNQKDIEPFIDPVFENNVILTQTERLMMSGRPKHPKYARNKNVIVIGGSGSGKTRFYVKPNLMQMPQKVSYVLTDPKGTIIVECGKMLSDAGYIKSGKINCIIVKDLSRFGRNYIEMGKYLEQIFPMMGIRFIAINDNYDNANTESSDSDSIVVPFKNLLNDSYCRDISIKVRSQLDMKRRKGEFIGGYAIYGYCKDKRNKNRLVVDEYAADIVRSIYRRKLEGMSAQAIAEQLNSENVLAPSEYKRLCGLNYHSGFKAGTHAKWQAIQVLRILKNEIYTGTMVQGRRQKINYKIKKIRDVEESGWIRVPNMHEAIIQQKLFDTVQEVLKLDTCASKGQQTVNLFSGIVRCGGCGQNMVRRTVSKNGKKYIYLHCVTNHNGLGCSSHLISESKLAEVVLAALQGKVQQISGLEHRLDEINEIPKNERRLKSVEEHLKMLEQEEQKYQTLRRQLYEDMSSGIVSKEEYKEFSHSFNEKVETIRKAKAEMNRQRDCLNNLDVEHLPWIEDFKSYQNLTSLNRRVLVELVESITVYDKEHIHIQYRFDQEIRNVLEYCSSVPAAETEESAV